VEASKAAHAAAREEIRSSRDQLDSIRKSLEQDLQKLNRYMQLAKEVGQLGNQFLRLYTIFAVQARYRPTLQQLHRLRLNEDQERFVARDHEGAFRIQGASGSGKTIILVHRALRLALENPASVVRVFTINRSLADLIRSSIATVHGVVPGNLYVAAFYDFLIDVTALFENVSRFRLIDDLSGERIAGSWNDFYNHRGKCPTVNVFADQTVRDLITHVIGRGKSRVDASQYLRDEAIYIQSGYRNLERRKYRDAILEPRKQRSIPMTPAQRMLCILVLEAWEEWLQVGELCDVEGLSLRAADHFDSPSSVEKSRAAFPTDFILADEVQDFSTIELRILRQLLPNAGGKNVLFLVGDRNQKVFAKHHRTAQAGYNFRGNAAVLRQNYRNTRQILQAAYRLPQAFPPPDEEESNVADPDLSSYEAGSPVVLQCTNEDHIATILDIVRRRSGNRVAIVSENTALLTAVRSATDRAGVRSHELFRVEDMDLWRQQGDVLKAEVVFSRLEAVKGFEFDTVVVCDLSAGVIPRPGTPEDEYWREAAIVYTALTRARDELILTYVDEPSLFLKLMADDVVAADEGGKKLREVLAKI
jgi:superfamily I DNA/RNA helicase